MQTIRFEVLGREEVEHIHGASMEVLATVGVQVDWPRARDLFRSAGADVNDGAQCVRISEDLIHWAVRQAPTQFTLFGSDADFQMQIGGESVCFAGLGTPTHVIDTETGLRRLATMADVIRHI